MGKLLDFIKSILLGLRYCLSRNRIVINQALLSGKGSFVEVRYWLSRPDKISPQARMYLIHHDTGAHLQVMKLARIVPLQSNHAVLGKTGSALFRNRDGLVRSGSKVCLVLGTLRTDNIEVT